MLPIEEIPAELCRQVQTLYTDIDDTLTTDGKIPAAAFDSLWRAHDAGIQVVPVTGRPAGWCDQIARMWPVAAVVGENGALAFALSSVQPRVMKRIYSSEPNVAADRLNAIATQITEEVPGCKVAADQPYRLFDLAIDFREEVDPLTDGDIDRIVKIFEAHGATAKVSSIHVNGWFGQFDKLTMCHRCSAEFLGRPLDKDRDIFIGDSPNDVPMFRFFSHAIGVANVRSTAHRMECLPRYVTKQSGGAGFAEALDELLTRR